ncbi:glycosyltransferase family 2 protein [Burkholderia multivorans]|uniref:glycosyltransferase family 2 protein n=1 Tax=Burkholderia multivorans TaxID=87883 RepID=UPI0021BFEB23|nr:glycosyltransferase family 2 protein [Burkholderia multivorans]
MTRNPFISFVIPCYNVESYVSQTIDSILNQSVKSVEGFDTSFEIICVNDGSTDGTLAILQQYASRHDFISVLTQANSGLSAARNTGFRHATGKYTCFLDSDDWIASTFVEDIAVNDRTHSFDLALVNARVYDQVSRSYHAFYDNEFFERLCPVGRSALISPRIHPDAFLLEPNTSRRVINTAFARFIKLEYPVGLLYEDYPVHFSTFMQAGSVLLINKPLYFYRVGRSGKLTERNDKRRFDIVNIFRQTAQWLALQNAAPDVAFAFLRVASRSITWCLDSVPRYLLPEFNRAVVDFLNECPQWWLDGFYKSNVDTALKFRIFAMKHGFFSRYRAMSYEKRYKINESLRHLARKQFMKSAVRGLQALRTK